MTEGRPVGEAVGWASVLAVAACCGVPVLRAVGVAGAVLWTAGLGLAGAAVAALGMVLHLRHRSQACEECRRLGTSELHEHEHEGGRR